MQADSLPGSSPAITPAHLLATLIAGVPIVAHVLTAFGVYDVSATQQEALSDALTWAGVLAAAIVGSDTGLRASRNAAAARIVTSAAGAPAAVPAAVPVAAVAAPLAAAPPDDDDDGGGDADALAHVPAHDGPVPPDQGDTGPGDAR